MCTDADVEYSDGTYSFGEAATFSAGAHDWEFSSHEFRVVKPVKVVVVPTLGKFAPGVGSVDDMVITRSRSTRCIATGSVEFGSASWH